MRKLTITMPGRDHRPLEQALIKHLGKGTVVDFDDASVADQVEVVVAWRHEPGSLTRFANLKAIISYGAGADFLVADPTIPESVILSRTIDPGLKQQMASYVLAAVLPKAHGLASYHEASRKGLWHPATRPVRASVGILGLGNMGAAIADAFVDLGHEVFAWSRQSRGRKGVTVCQGDDGLYAMAPRVDFLICALPLTPDMRGILNLQLFDAMRDSAWLVNVGRGEHLQEGDLLTALDRGWLAGAVLDVFAEEPLSPDSPLRADPRIEMTPHVAAITDPEGAAAEISGAFLSLMDGRPIKHVVDRQRGY